MIIKQCQVCNKDFKSYPSRNRLHCSRRCGNLNKNGTYKKGHPWFGKLRTEKRIMSHGYIETYAPNHPFKSSRNSVLEHRLVMEKHIGRFLKKEEVVHHINNLKHDNRIENLQLFLNQSDHMKYGHPKI